MSIVLSTSESAKLEPKRKNRWIVSFDAVPGNSTTAPTSLAFCAHTGTRPTVTFNSTEVHRINEKWKFANKPDWSDLPFTFYDFITADGVGSAFTIIKNWWNKIYQPLTGQMGYAIEYKTHGTLAMLDPKGVVVQTWHLFYVWPTSVNYQNVSYEDEGISEVDVSFKYDYAVPGTETGLGSNVTGPSGEPYPTIV